MTRRRDIEKHRRSLVEVRDIMNSMKNLSYMETRKISGLLECQKILVEHIEKVAADFLSYHPATLVETTSQAVAVYLLIGTERGFCGDFNLALLRHLETIPVADNEKKRQIICIGHKLKTALEGSERAISFIDGASVADEISDVLNRIIEQLTTIQTHIGQLDFYVVYHEDAHQVIEKQLLPPFQNQPAREPQQQAPVLNLDPATFLLDLSLQYLFAVLNEILYASLMAESRTRVAHLEGAVRHIDEQSEELQRLIKTLRQEEIIEEIEVILLSAAGIDA